MGKLSIETCVAAINRAAINRKSAFQIELAVGLAVYLNSGGTDKLAKAMLCNVYASAGYKCMSVNDMDYKTVNRRVNVSADLFNTLGQAKVEKWAGRHAEDRMIESLMLGVEPYELYTVSDVIRLCTPPATRKPPTKILPASDILAIAGNAPLPKGQQTVVDMFRRAADQVAKGARHFETKHLALMVPDTTTRDEMIEMAHRLLSLADELQKVLIAS